MSSINLVQAKPFTLLEPIGTSETEISVKNFVDIYGEQVVMSGTVQYATLEPTSLDNQEIISFTDIVIISDTISKLTGVTRWLDAQPDPVTGLYSSSPTQAKSHAGGSLCILSDNPQVWDKKTSKDEDETVTGDWTFTEPVTIPTPVAGTDAVTKDYADGLTYAGAPDASTTVKGVTRLTTSPNVTLGTCTITIATPWVITLASHGLTLNDSVEFTTTGTLPTGIVASTKYFVLSSGLTTNEFQISATLGGTAINTSVGQSGTHTLYKTTPVSVWVNDTRLPTQDENDALVGTSGTPSASNKYVTNDDTSATPVANKVARYSAGGQLPWLPSQAFFGDGSDGDVTISSNTSLTRDMYYDDLTIQTGFTLSTKGYRIFVKGTLNCEWTGKIASNWWAGGTGAIGVSTGVAPAGGAAWAADYTGATLPTPKVWVIGGAGGYSPNGITGTAVTLNETMTAAVAGGAGGAGSFGSPGTGWAAGSAGSNPVMRPRTYQSAYNLYDMTGSTITRHEIAPTGGSGGGGGGNGGNNIWGGGGGSGSTGWFISIFANIITNLNVEALGWAGGAGGATNILNTGGGGGWAGWNGWFILLFYGSKTTVTGTVTWGAGGSGWVATAPATNSGVAGTAGNSWVVLQIQI